MAATSTGYHVTTNYVERVSQGHVASFRGGTEACCTENCEGCRARRIPGRVAPNRLLLLSKDHLSTRPSLSPPVHTLSLKELL